MADQGELVYVPTDVDAGAFPGEKLVTIETDEGPISGFARDESIHTDGGDSYIKAEVRGQSASGKFLTVLLFGSFFTTTGLATISSDRVLRAP